MRRPTLLAALLLLLLVPPAASAAEVTHVLWGGRITSEGTASGSMNMNAQRAKRTESVTANWKSSYIAEDLYQDTIGQVAVVGEHSWQDRADAHSTTVSGTTHDHRMGYDASTHTWSWNDPVDCSLTGKDDDPGGLTPPADDEPGRPVHVDPAGTIEWHPGSSCSSGDRPDAYSHVSDGIFTGAVAQFKIGRTPTVGPRRTQPISFSQPKSDCSSGPSTSPCSQQWSGSGKVTLECVLCITSMTFEHPNYPSGDVTTVPNAGTIDGNKVYVTAKVQNRSDYHYPALIEWRERRSNRVLMTPLEGKQLYTFPANQTTTVVLEWDTTGFAYEKGKPMTDREVELRTPLGGGFAKVKVRPRPVVMVHGWKAKAGGWDPAKGLLSKVHPLLAGQGYAVGDGRYPGEMDTGAFAGKSIDHNAKQLATYIQALRDDTEAAHVDLLVHSMGGLISRYYIQFLMPKQSDYHPVVPSLVMLGTPNRGSSCADLIMYATPGIPTLQLRPAYVDVHFNRFVRDFKGVRPSILAGTLFDETCLTPKVGDGVVTTESAQWLLTDYTETSAHHVELTDLGFLYDGWIKKRLGLDPDAAHNFWQYDPKNPFPGHMPGRRVAAPATTAEGAEAGAPEIQGIAGRAATVPAGGSVDVDLPVSDGTALGAAVDAPPAVASELVAPDGTVVDAVAAETDRARLPIRVHSARSPASGTWKLRLSQAGGEPVEVRVGAGVEGSALRLAGTGTQAAEGGPIGLRAQYRSGDAPVTGARVTAELTSAAGETRTVELAERGAGEYRTETEALPAGEWFATLRATGAGGDRMAALVVGPPSGDGDGDGGTDTSPPPVVEERPGPPVGPPVGPPEPPINTGPIAPRAVTLAARAKRDRRKPFAFRLTGTVEPPAGATCAAGQVVVALARGKKTLASRRVKLDARCGYRATLKVKGRGKLKATARFLGSEALLPAASRAVKLRAG